MIKILGITAERELAILKWNEVDVDVAAECTGFFTTKDTCKCITLLRS
jgi:glyceraldehyde 3-phosphate dehydrogenase